MSVAVPNNKRYAHFLLREVTMLHYNIQVGNTARHWPRRICYIRRLTLDIQVDALGARPERVCQYGAWGRPESQWDCRCFPRGQRGVHWRASEANLLRNCIQGLVTRTTPSKTRQLTAMATWIMTTGDLPIPYALQVLTLEHERRRLTRRDGRPLPLLRAKPFCNRKDGEYGSDETGEQDERPTSPAKPRDGELV